MKADWKICKLRKRDVMALLVGLYVLNYFVTPVFVGEVKLESYYRPRLSEKFDPTIWKESGLIPDGALGKWSPSFGKRYAMVDDILKTRISLGMEEERIKAILGHPDAGIVDKKSLVALRDPYGFNKLNPAKELLESPDNIAYWAYHLADQRVYPATSIWFPKLFWNFDRWKLIIKMKNGKVCDLNVSFS